MFPRIAWECTYDVIFVKNHSKLLKIMKNTLIGLFLSVLLASLFTGCVNNYVRPMSADSKAKLFQPDPEVSTIYVFRSESLAKGVKIPIFLDGAAVAQTSAHSFLLLQVAPGVHTVLSKTATEDSLQLTTEAGHNYFIWQEIKFGLLSPGSKLHLLDGETGRAGVKQCTLIEGYL